MTERVPCKDIIYTHTLQKSYTRRKTPTQIFYLPTDYTVLYYDIIVVTDDTDDTVYYDYYDYYEYDDDYYYYWGYHAII